jgi:hypothetical protein
MDCRIPSTSSIDRPIDEREGGRQAGPVSGGLALENPTRGFRRSVIPCQLLWARLSDSISVQMKCGTYHLRPNDWNSGDNLWFVDLIAPFGHGKDVARFVIKNPPPEQFQFARVGSSGGIERVISGDASRQRGTRMKTSFPNREWVDL